MIDVVPAEPFRMQGTREVLGLFYAGSSVLTSQVDAIERALGDGNAGIALDVAKSLVETACKTVLKDCGEADGDIDQLKIHELVKKTLVTLQPALVGSNADGRVTQSLEKTLKGLLNMVVGIAELRNVGGITGHGRDAYMPVAEVAHAFLAARSADAAVAFLFQVHRTMGGAPVAARLRLDDNTAFNEWVDASNDPVSIFELSYQPSEVLFRVDPEAYREYLLEFQAQSTERAEPSPGEPET